MIPMFRTLIARVRFMTNGSGEKEKIIEMLDKLVG